MAARKAKKKDAHPEEELQRLQGALERGLPPAVILKGEERYFVDRAVRLCTQAAQQAGHELCRHDGKDPEFKLASLLDDVAGGALFASARCVVVYNGGDLLKKTGQGASPAFLKAATARLAAGGADLLVLHAPAARADNALVKTAVAAGGLLLACRKLWETPPPWDPDPRKAELVQWLVGRARARQVRLSPDEAAYVALATGNDLAALDEQLSRLEAGAKDGATDLRQVVSWSAGGSPYPLAEKIALGDGRGAVSGIESLFGGGFVGKDGTRTLDSSGLASMLCNALASKVRESLATAEALAAGAAEKQALDSAGLRGSPTAMKATLARARARTPDQWRACLSQVAALERRSRSGAVVDAADFCGLALAWRLGPRR